MNILINCFVVLVAVLHLYFLTLEMFLWTKPLGLKTFRNTIEKARDTSVLAANQGLYNGFLSAGLIWGLLQPEEIFAKQIKLFFLGCVFVAGVYGAYSVNKRIFFIQGLPALIGFILLLI
jgi:putative membrane protein